MRVNVPDKLLAETAYDDIKKIDLEAMCKTMLIVRDHLDEMGKLKTTLQKFHDYLRHGAIPDKMDEQNITTITFDDIGRVSLTSDLRASIKKDNREKAYKWLEKQGFADLIQETINASSLKAFCKARIKKGDKLPEDLFTVSPFSRASITKV